MQKRCIKCNQEKELDSFHLMLKAKDGRQAVCKVCSLFRLKMWRLDNLEIARERKRKYDRENKEFISQSRKEKYWQNPEKCRSDVLELRRKNPTKYRAIASETHARRRALMLHAVPAWSDKDKVKKVYAEAAKLNSIERRKYAVDHIVPLQSKIVCGLHNEFNLQILGLSANISKGNKHWPDMP